MPPVASLGSRYLRKNLELFRGKCDDVNLYLQEKNTNVNLEMWVAFCIQMFKWYLLPPGFCKETKQVAVACRRAGIPHNFVALFRISLSLTTRFWKVAWFHWYQVVDIQNFSSWYICPSIIYESKIIKPENGQKKRLGDNCRNHEVFWLYLLTRQRQARFGWIWVYDLDAEVIKFPIHNYYSWQLPQCNHWP